MKPAALRRRRPGRVAGRGVGAGQSQGKGPAQFRGGSGPAGLADPQLSPDGKQVAFVINRADWKANRHIGHIFRINIDGTNQVQMTFGERGESNPRWSPDSKSIAFTARRDGDTSNQIYLLHADGGEARRVTSHPTAAGSPA